MRVQVAAAACTHAHWNLQVLVDGKDFGAALKDYTAALKLCEGALAALSAQQLALHLRMGLAWHVHGMACAWHETGDLPTTCAEHSCKACYSTACKHTEGGAPLTTRARLLSGRALAYEGISDWAAGEAAQTAYSTLAMGLPKTCSLNVA